MGHVLVDIVWVLSVILALFVGGFLRSYMSKKGENFATHEDINKLVDQITAVTTTTEEIKAKISDDVWNRQKRWELKRDVVLDAVKRTADLDDAVTRVHAVFTTEKVRRAEGMLVREENRLAASTTFGKAANDFDQAVSLVRLVCGDATIRVFHEFGRMSRQLYQDMTTGMPEAFLERAKAYVDKQKAMTDQVRKELDIDKS